MRPASASVLSELPRLERPQLARPASASPDDDEIDEATLESSEVVDAASYLEFMMATDPESYDALIAERATPWGSDPAQPLDRCLAHTLSIIYRRIQLTKHGRRQSSDPQVNPQRSHLGASPAPASASARHREENEHVTEEVDHI